MRPHWGAVQAGILFTGFFVYCRGDTPIHGLRDLTQGWSFQVARTAPDEIRSFTLRMR